MSTFDGKVKEFPDIRIDHFRLSSETSRPPLAYLLSHVHSDHLEGLESCKSPFIYCSPATREILLRLEKYPHRMNFGKGILETRKQTYKHLRKLLKTIPLETPTILDLAPGRSVRVTLFDANHCVGAVMFLIEGEGKAILYTGDIRSEIWWVNNLARHPLMLPYASHGGKASLKRLDCIYLDTTFATKENPYKHFPSKADGTFELLQKVSKYPKETTFYFDTWTFGYEDVWVALCGFLNCQVHVDDYRYKLYRALATGEEIKAEEAARLFGYQCGNHLQEGCLTRQQTRLHSCEQGTGCEVFKKDYVRITPIISRHEGVEMAELGAGGGKGDLDQQHELEVGDVSSLGMLMSLCATKMQDQPELLSSVMQMLASIMRDPVRAITLDSAALHAEQPKWNQEEMAELEQMPLDRLIPALVDLASKSGGKSNKDMVSKATRVEGDSANRNRSLPKRITFPYSRHSSYTELCHLIEAFKPTDIWPCTVDKANWTTAQSMSFLFGHLCDAPCNFTHDQIMLRETAGVAAAAVQESRAASPGKEVGSSTDQTTRKRRRDDDDVVVKNTPPPPAQADIDTEGMFVHGTAVDSGARLEAQHYDSPSLSPHEYSEAWKRQAFDAAAGRSSTDWTDITLISVSGHHQEREEEL